MIKDLLTEGKGWKVENGDFVAGQSDRQHVFSIASAHPGTYRFAPFVGVGAGRFVKSSSVSKPEEALRKQLRLDGAVVERIALSPDDFEIIALYTKAFEIGALSVLSVPTSGSSESGVYTYTVLSNQNLPDIAIQETGDVRGVFAIAKLNKISITEPLEAGRTLLIDRAKIINRRVVEYLKERKTVIKTGK